jgi:hypothetical protein
LFGKSKHGGGGGAGAGNHDDNNNYTLWHTSYPSPFIEHVHVAQAVQHISTSTLGRRINITFAYLHISAALQSREAHGVQHGQSQAPSSWEEVRNLAL